MKAPLRIVLMEDEAVVAAVRSELMEARGRSVCGDASRIRALRPGAKAMRKAYVEQHLVSAL